MPTRPPRSCNKAGCKEVSNAAYCIKHTKEKQQQRDKQRGTAHQRGYNTQWRKARLIYLKHNPLCVRCKDVGNITAANVVDHIKPHKGNQKLMWDELNWQSLCKKCHDIKTATEDGGFGR